MTNRTLDNLVECLKNEIENTVTVILPPYSKIELTEIAKRTIENMGVMVEGKDTLAIIMKMMVEHNITTAKAAVSLGRDLIQYANFRDFNPVLELKNGDAKTMKKMVMLGGN